MLLMIAIAFYSYKKSSRSPEDFLIGGREMSAAVTALSAGAADMSGWLLMGVPGGYVLFWDFKRLDSDRAHGRSIFQLCSCRSSLAGVY